MDVRTRTIVCEPLAFDRKFQEEYKDIISEINKYERIEKITIVHDGNSHYITYIVNIRPIETRN